MGYIVKNKYIFEALYHHDVTNAAEKTLTSMAPCTVTTIDRNDQHVTMTLSSGDTITTPLLIAVDGKNSAIRGQTNITLSKKDYGQNALVVHLEHAKPHDSTAFEIFLPEGPLAVLPLKSKTCAKTGKTLHSSGIVWCKDNTYNFSALSDHELESTLLDLFPYLGALKITSPRWIYPLSMMKVSSLVEKRIALAGDAGHTMHPIAGQGVNLGWRDAQSLIDILSQSKQQGLDLGSPFVLNRYDKERKSDRLGLLYATDWINCLYKNQFLPLRVARNATFAILNRITPLKRTIMKRAMGLL